MEELVNRIFRNAVEEVRVNGHIPNTTHGRSLYRAFVEQGIEAKLHSVRVAKGQIPGKFRIAGRGNLWYEHVVNEVRGVFFDPYLEMPIEGKEPYLEAIKPYIPGSEIEITELVDVSY